MIWSKDINKAFGTRRNAHYPGRKMLDMDGYYGGTAITMHHVAIKSHDEGFTCPHCGGGYDERETTQRVMHETFPPFQPFVETETQCLRCRKVWSIRARLDGQAIVYYDTAR